MKFNITLNDQDIIDFLVCVFSNIPESVQKYKAERFFLILVISSSIFCIYLFLSYKNGFGFMMNLAIGSIVGLTIGIIAILLLAKTSYKNFIIYTLKKRTKQLKSLCHKNQFTAELTDTEMKETFNDLDFSSRKYSEIKRILTDKEHIYIMTGVFDAMILPLRCLDGYEKEVLDFIRSKM